MNQNINSEISQNVYIRNIRRYKKINIFKAAHSMRMLALKLFSLERGYLKLSNKDKKKLESFYNLEEGKLDHYNEVPSPIAKIKKDKKSRFKRIKESWITISILLILMVICIIYTPINYNKRIDMLNNANNYLSEEYNKFSIGIKENAQIGFNVKEGNIEIKSGQTAFLVLLPDDNVLTDLYLARTSAFYYYEKCSFKDDYNNVGESIVLLSTEDTKSAVVGFVSYINDGKYQAYFDLIYRGGADDELQGNLYVYDIETKEEFSDMVFYNQKKRLYDIYESSSYTDEDTLKITAFIKEYKDKLFAPLDAYIKLTTSRKSFDDFNDNVLKSVYEYSEETVSLWSEYVITTFLAILFFTLAFSCVINKRKKHVGSNLYRSMPRDRSSIIKNNWPSPFIKEGYFKALGLLLTGLVCWTTYFVASKTVLIIGIQPNEAFLNWLVSSNYIFKLGALVIVIFSTKNYIRDENPYRTLFIFFVLSVFYFFFEIYLVERITQATILSFFGQFEQYLPSNFFLAIFLLMLMATFLFRTPSLINKKWKLIVYRLLSLLPFSFFVISYTCRLLAKNGVFTMPKYLNYIFPEKLFGVELFGILFIVGMYIFEQIIIAKKGIPYLKQFKYTNKYYWIENFIIVGLLLILALIENNPFLIEKMHSIGVGKLKYCYLLIPILLFYHPRVEPLDKKVTIFYTLGMLFGMIVPYLLLAFNILLFLFL